LTWKPTRRYALMASIAPGERLRRELEDVIGGAGEELDPIEAIGRLGARLILQQALEEELSDLPRPRALRASRRAGLAPQRLRAGDGEDDGGAAGVEAAGYSSFRQVRGSAGWAFGVRSSRKL
jgi:hypothetical protein